MDSRTRRESVAAASPADGGSGKSEVPAGAGSPHAGELARLFEQHNRHLVRLLEDRLGNEAEAREVAQEAYVRVLRLDRPGAISFLRAYLYKTAANIAVDRIRRRSEPEALAFDADELIDRRSPDRRLSARESLETVRRALVELPESHRRAFELSRFDHKSTAEIGRTLGLRSTQTRLYLRRALAYCTLRMAGASRAAAERKVFS